MIVIAVVAGLVGGSAATWLIMDSRERDPNPIEVGATVVNTLGEDTDLFGEAVERWRALPAAERPRGEVTVLHAAGSGDREIAVLIDETGLGAAYERGAETGEIQWVEQLGGVAREGGAGADPSSAVLGDGAWIETRARNSRVEAAVLTGDEVRWEKVSVENGITAAIPALGADRCGAKVLAEHHDNGVRFHLLRPRQSNVGTSLHSYLRPLDAEGKHSAEDRPVRDVADLGAAELRMVSRLACSDRSEFTLAIPHLFAMTEWWSGTLPSGETASVDAISATTDSVLLTTGDESLVIPFDFSAGLNAVVWWFDDNDRLVAAGSPGVERIDVVLPDGRRVSDQGRFLSVELGELTSSRARGARVSAVDAEGLPATVLPR
ncbi:hypothetical protein SAMN05421630_101742 [Prauserella marina]|uniref:Uncharacterized protein n=1 Tax=Prauserella marina TaxID=530584 RepID=A0A1G6JJ97_9PSEU|nr:hypothetical protein [Prauserella marina]PWV84577.1 hypothetical protein DES30_101594 [Prauserella marina]SDC18728.1 hypothetical protein SAMN05421630_101742 [Prauserella marina]